MTTQDTGAGPVDQRVQPCPFCGSTNGNDEQGQTYRWRLWRCECGACGAEVRCNITGSGQGGVKEARSLAIDEWNQRAPQAIAAGPCDCMPTPAMCRAAVEYMNGADVYEKVPRDVLDIEEGIYREVWLAMQDKAPSNQKASG
jgi:Lar family restriction alleviation protein